MIADVIVLLLMLAGFCAVLAVCDWIGDRWPDMPMVADDTEDDR